MIWFTMLNMLKKVVMMTTSVKQQEKITVEEKQNAHILKYQIKKELPCPQYEN